MPNKAITGYKEKQVYRNERFTKGTVSTNDPLFEGSFRRLVNFKVSNQNASIENREPFLTVPLFDLQNQEIKLSKDAFVFALNDDTEHAYILDLKQEKIIEDNHTAIFLERDINDLSKFEVIDGDTIIVNGTKYRLALVDCPEIDDYSFKPFNEEFKTLGQEAKDYTSKFLSQTFSVVQFNFQPEKEDQFGRKIAFVVKRVYEEVYQLLNINLLKEGYAQFYNLHNFDKEEVNFYIKEKIKIDNVYFNLFSEAREAYMLGLGFAYYCYGSNYTDTVLNILIDSEKSFYTKPVVYKIKKQTDLKQIQIQENGIYKDIIIKRVLNKFEINETDVKKDLEIANDDSLNYEFIERDFTIINGKYRDQYVNFIVHITNQFGAEVYRGIIELNHTRSIPEDGIEETFSFVTYKRPSAHIEIHDLSNSKPNMADDRTIIPQTYIGVKSNVKGYTSPSVNAVLLNVTLNKKLERSLESDDEVVTKYFQTNRAIFDDITRYTLTPFFKAPELNSEKKNYMYRWDFVNLKEIDFGNEEAVKNAKPFYRTAWTNLDTQENISMNSDRLKNIATNIKNIRGADEFYFIKSIFPKKEITTTDPINIEDIYDSDEATKKSLKELQTIFNDFIEQKTFDEIKTFLKTNAVDMGESLPQVDGTVISLNGYLCSIVKVKDKAKLLESLNLNEKEDSLTYEEIYGQQSKPLNLEERENIFDSEENKNKKVAFIFCPVDLIYQNGSDSRMLVSHAWETKGIVFDLSTDKKVSLPYNINFGLLKKQKIDDFDFEDFFKNGIQATFYLYNYVNAEDLTEVDEFYDMLAYKKSSATYTFRRGNIFKYSKEDFIDDRLDKESYAIKYSKYMTTYQDRILVYGNPIYKNSVFMSEEGTPYYFALMNTFEFDHEVVHVQAFKTILLVFTINDIWVIYPWEETNKETFVTTITYRFKKILYNISTEVKNKDTIKNITRYVTLMSNNVLYLIKPSTYISDDTEFYLNILSQNIDAIVKDPLYFINERLRYHGILEEATEYDMSLNATDNYIKLYYSTSFGNLKKYTLILTYDILNNRWYEEDTCSFGSPKQIYLLDSTTKYEMLTEMNNQLFITYQTDKYKLMMLDKYKQSYYDKNYFKDFSIEYFIDSGYLKLNEHLKKRFKTLQVNIKNIDSKQIMFTYNFTIDDRQFENNFEPYYTTNDSNLIVEIQKLKAIGLEINRTLSNAKDQKLLSEIKEKIFFMENLDEDFKKSLLSDIGTLENFILDFSNLQTGDIITVNQPLLGIGRLPRIQLGFSSKNRFYILSFGMIYSEHGGK